MSDFATDGQFCFNLFVTNWKSSIIILYYIILFPFRAIDLAYYGKVTN